MTGYKDITVSAFAARKVDDIARLNGMTDADVIDCFMELVDDVCKLYGLKQWDWQKKEA